MISYQPIIQNISIHDDFHVDVLRLDKIHDKISGNKWFKLKNNLAKAKSEQYNCVLTFGGANSNHIAATAEACKLNGLDCVGVIRGEEVLPLNQTLLLAKKNGMILHYVNRDKYRNKSALMFTKELKSIFGNFYMVPEGGSNKEGIEGCLEILHPHWNYDYVFCACGTGTTFTGLLMNAGNSKIIGISVLKGKNTMPFEVHNNIELFFGQKSFLVKGNEEMEEAIIQNNCITNNYCFGGYANYSDKLIKFKNEFEEKFTIPLDYIYTNKLFYAVFDLIQKRKLKGRSRILVVHSGGLQGNTSFESRYHLKPIR